MSLAAGFCASGVHAQCDPHPTPAGPHDSPSSAFSVKEYAFVHSSSNLQSRAAHTLTAAGLFWHPTDSFGTGFPRAFGAFSSAIVVNNPDPSRPTRVVIEYFDQMGALLGTSGSMQNPIPIPANGSHIEDASMLGAAGIGSAKITVVDSTQDAAVLGSTLHYFDSIAVPGWGIVVDPDRVPLPGSLIEVPAGEGSYQRLQQTPVQPETDQGWHFAGPFRFTNTSQSDFDNGSAPVLMIANPNAHPVPIALVTLLVGPNGVLANLGARTHTLAPNGMVMDGALWNSLNNLSRAATGPYDFDILVGVLALDGSALVGDALVIDAFGDDEGTEQNGNLNLGRRMRMTSTAIAAVSQTGFGHGSVAIGGDLVATDVSTFTPTGGVEPMIRTGLKLVNVGFAPTAPVTVEYFSHDGTLLATDVISRQASPQGPAIGLEPFATLHIESDPSGQTPNFPGNLWNGSVRIRANCQSDRLMGWTSREIGSAPASWSGLQLRKAFGEELFCPESSLPDGFRVASIVRTTPSGSPNYWPGYTTFGMDFGQTNSGVYSYRFFQPSGTESTNLLDQPFDGIPFGGSSFTYEDSDLLPNGVLSTMSGNGSARIDFEFPISFSHGINVLGDPFWEFDIGNFARRGLGPIPGYTPLPIDPHHSNGDDGYGPGVPTGKE
jgi:hypothetical protein